MKPNDIVLTTIYKVGDDTVTIKQSAFKDSLVDISFTSEEFVTKDTVTLGFDNIDELRNILNNAETLFKTVVSKSEKL